jgi:hypothetical protein
MGTARLAQAGEKVSPEQILYRGRRFPKHYTGIGTACLAAVD